MAGQVSRRGRPSARNPNHRSAGSPLHEDPQEQVTGTGRGQGRHQRAQRAPHRELGHAALAESATLLALARRSVRRGLGHRSRAAAAARAQADGHHAAAQAAGRSPRPLPRRHAAHPAAAHPPLARAGRTAQGSVLPARPCAGPSRPVGLHRHGRVARHDCQRAVRAHPVPLRAGLLALGACGSGRGRRELRGVVQGAAERPVAGRRRAAGAPQRQPVGGVQEPDRRRGLHRALHGAARSLRHGRHAQQPRPEPRERQRRVLASVSEGGDRAGAAAARPPRLRRPGGLRGLRARGRDAAQSAQRGGVPHRARATAGPAGAPHAPTSSRKRRASRAAAPSPCAPSCTAPRRA